MVEVLLVEDDPGHAVLIRKSLKRTGFANEIRHVENGRQALDYLNNVADEGDRPALVLLDLNMPEMDGYTTLEHIRADARLRDLPVIILTTTSEPYEVERCYKLGCNAFVNKPIDYVEFTEAIRKLGLFLSIVQVPEGFRVEPRAIAS